jgi:histidinol-phosphate aminotransferase
MSLVPDYIHDMMSYVPGKLIESARKELGLENIIKLASNENPLGPSPRAMAGMRKALNHVNRFPDTYGFMLRTKLAEKYDLDIRNVILGAGSEGIMNTILRTFLLNTDEIITAANSFMGFRVLANSTGRKVHWVPMKDHHYDLEGIKSKINENTKIIYIANPDNPLGTFVSSSSFINFHQSIPDRVLIILDEAYFEIAQQYSDYPDSLKLRYDNVITLRTFSKFYGLAGMRIGYGFARKDLINNLIKVKVPFEPSYLAQIAGFTSLDDKIYHEKSLALINDGKKYYYSEFEKLGIKHIPSATNFITTLWNSEEQAESITSSMLKNGIIIRHLAAFGWPKYIRISIGHKEENEQCIAALKNILS